MEIIIKGRIERRVNQLGLTNKQVKQHDLIAKWKVIDGKLVCPLRKV